VERTIILDDVLFDFDKSNIKPEAGAILDRLVAFMNENRDKKVNLSGHTDNVGTEAYNQRLSERRANSVKDYIAKKGVDANRISAQGFGESKPIADNKTREGRAKNRRVEIKPLWKRPARRTQIRIWRPPRVPAKAFAGGKARRFASTGFLLRPVSQWRCESPLNRPAVTPERSDRRLGQTHERRPLRADLLAEMEVIRDQF
jgi:hypothetical protein